MYAQIFNQERCAIALISKRPMKMSSIVRVNGQLNTAHTFTLMSEEIIHPF